MPVVLREASRTAAKASGKMGSRVAGLGFRRERNSSVLAFNFESESFLNSGSRTLILATRGRILPISRSLKSKILVIKENIYLKGYRIRAILGEPQWTAAFRRPNNLTFVRMDALKGLATGK